MNDMMHVIQIQNDACNARKINVCDAIMIFWVHGWSFESFSLIKLWVQIWVSTLRTRV